MGTGLGIGVVVGLLVRTPQELLDMVDGPLGATLGVGLAVWTAMDKWQAELSGTGTCGLKAVARVVGLVTPMVAVGASIALAGHTLSLTQGGLVAAALGVLCVLLVVVQTWSLLTSSGRNG